ncbi:hypothetical protein A2U01_0080232, partial [Trifolium medium]|nr:hypothetical protein [Trifolium medium]
GAQKHLARSAVLAVWGGLVPDDSAARS